MNIVFCLELSVIFRIHRSGFFFGNQIMKIDKLIKLIKKTSKQISISIYFQRMRQNGFEKYVSVLMNSLLNIAKSLQQLKEYFQELSGNFQV